MNPLVRVAMSLAAVAVFSGLLFPHGIAFAWAQNEDVGPADEVDSGEAQAQPEEGGLEAEAQSTGATEPGESDAVELEEEEEEEEDIGGALGLTLLGTASVATGILFFINSDETETLADEAAAGVDRIREEDLRDRADRENTLGIVLTSLGIAMLGGATYLWITQSEPDQSATEESPVEEAVHFFPDFGLDGSVGFCIEGVF